MRRLLAVAIFASAPSWEPTGASAQEAAATARDEEARRRYEAGETAFAAGEYEAALALFQSAYERSPRPGLLYNMGHCADRLRRDDDAIRWFERYLNESEPTAPQRGDATLRLRALREAQATHQEVALTAPASSPESPAAQPTSLPGPQPTSDVTSEPWFWSLLIGVGVVAVGASVTAAVIESQPRPERGTLGEVITALQVRW